ncbi:MAG: aspartate--tRNA ligase, partial [Paludibacteraceae bacterium]|nr:aspartate--tRNA ligase [Paludibacteraceae bacterium]
MYRSNTCGELRLSNVGSEVKLAGWVQKVRKMGGMTFVDLRDRYGITQIVFDEGKNADLTAQANHIGREWVIQVTGKVCERSNKNTQIPTGEIEIIADNMKVLSKSEVPPFTIEDNSDGGDDLRMQYRYLDLRRKPVLNNLVLRHNIAFETRRYLDSQGFLEVETPVLIKSTPEGARDFVVPSRMNQGQFYALPQSPQQFKQLLMVGGIDRYFQIVKCFRDEDLRADRQPEFTQIDCEMSYVEQEDVLQMFEGMIKHIFKYARGVEFTDSFPRLTWHECMKRFGSDKPDMRFGMEFVELKNTTEGGEDLVSGHSFPVFDGANFVVAICANGCASWTRKQLDQMTEFVKRPQVGAKGLVYIQMKEDGTIKSSIDKFYDEASLRKIAEKANAKAGDLILILCGDDAMKVRGQMNTLRLEMGDRLELRDKNKFAPLWVIDFPLFEWNEEDQRFYAMHHPFTSPKLEDVQYLDSDPGRVRANAYDLAMNGVELGGGSVRIHDSEL